MTYAAYYRSKQSAHCSEPEITPIRLPVHEGLHEFNDPAIRNDDRNDPERVARIDSGKWYGEYGKGTQMVYLIVER